VLPPTSIGYDVVSPEPDGGSVGGGLVPDESLVVIDDRSSTPPTSMSCIPRESVVSLSISRRSFRS
jgi:hypothetical protein